MDFLKIQIGQGDCFALWARNDIKMQICIIGGGVVGLNIALELSGGGLKPSATAPAANEVFLLEQEKFLGHHTSTRNSEVIHAGFAYPPESLKARLCVEGNRLTYELLAGLGVPCKRCGKWVIACNPAEAAALTEVEKNAHVCGVKGFRRAKVEEYYRAEPAAHEVSAVAFSESSGILDAAAYIRALEVALSKRPNVNIIYPCKVTAIDSIKRVVETDRGPIQYDLMINSAGLWADEVFAMACRNEDFQMCDLYQIVPFKGEYYAWRKGKVQTMIYPVPSRFISKVPSPQPSPQGRGGDDATLVSSMGIHTHRNFAGELFVGPSQVKLTPDKKSDYSINTPPQVFADAIAHFVKDIRAEDLEPAYAGNRPKLYKGGHPIGDFEIFRKGNFIHLLGMESPALTAAPAIAKHVARMI